MQKKKVKYIPEPWSKIVQCIPENVVLLPQKEIVVIFVKNVFYKG